MIQKANLDKNMRIGSHVKVINKDHVQEATRSALGFTICSGFVVIETNASLPDGTII